MKWYYIPWPHTGRGNGKNPSFAGGESRVSNNWEQVLLKYLHVGCHYRMLNLFYRLERTFLLFKGIWKIAKHIPTSIPKA